MSSNAGKVSFSVQSKLSSKSKHKPSRPTHQDEEDEDQNKKEFVTEFDPAKTLTKTKTRLIIPPKAPESRPHKKMKNIDLPLTQPNDSSNQRQWDLQNKADEAADANQISYGLNLRKSSSCNPGEDGVAASTVEAQEKPQLKDEEKPKLKDEEKPKLKDVKLHLESLPEDEGLEQYDEMPVEGFGAALLAGLGWYEGRGLGKNPKGNVQIKQIEKKSFVSDYANSSLMGNRNKERDERDGASVGKHMGSKGSNRKDKESKHRSRGNENRDDRNEREKHSKNKSRESSNYRSRISWLRSHIRVKIISKEFRRGKLYLKKGEVVDVVGPTTCDISLDESGELVQGVDQDFLQTALPITGGPVLVLNGKYKGVYGTLVERNKDGETGVIRDADTHQLLKVELDEIAEYIGDPSYIGY